MSVRVRSLQAADSARWRDLFQQYITFYQATVAGDVIDLTWQRLLAGADGMAGLVSIDDADTITGLAVIVFHRSSWAADWYCYLEDLFVDPACRGQGIGQALIEAVYTEADRRGASRTYWATHTDNATARRLYDHLAKVSPFVQYVRDENGPTG